MTEGENRVLEYFDEILPLSWEIYIQPHLNGLRPDFVLLHPKNGIAVYEVKDWDLDAMEYFVEQGTHSPTLKGRTGGKTFSLEKQNPVTKIQLYKDELHNLYCPSLPSRDGYGSIVAGIIFPNATTASASQLLAPLRSHYKHTDHERLYPILGSDLLQNHGLTTIKKSVLPSIQRPDARMNDGAAADLRHWLVEPEFARNQRRPLTADLSHRQMAICLNMGAVSFRRIRGPAGSGKSLVLAGRAAELAKAGKKVLVVTYNITLINYLMDLAVRYAETGAIRKRIEAMNFHHWCGRVAHVTGHSADYKALWSLDLESVLIEQLPTSAKNWTKDLDDSEKWDAILVDEGQDFHAGWWAALRSSLKVGGEMLLCADKSQNIYGVASWTDAEMTDAGFTGRWMELETSYRMPAKLCGLASQFIREHLPGAENMPPNPPQGRFEFNTNLEWRQVRPDDTVSTCVEAMLQMIDSSDPPLAYADMVCLVDDVAIGDGVVRALSKKGLNALHTFGRGPTESEINRDSRRRKLRFYKGDARIKVTTIQSFKGWESRALVVQISKSSGPESCATAYTGITRLKLDDHGSHLTVVCSASALSSYGNAWAAT